MSDIPIRIKRQKRRSLMMRRTPHAVEVYIPHWLSPESRLVRRFIAAGIAQLPPPPQHAILTTEADIRALARQWAAKMGLKPKRITLREMTRKWGSCSSKDNITLNKALQFVPPRLVEYVIVHELAHLLAFNHGPEFQDILSHYLPDWREREAELGRVRL